MPSDLALRHAQGDEQLAGIIDQALEEVLRLIRDWREVLENKKKVEGRMAKWSKPLPEFVKALLDNEFADDEPGCKISALYFLAAVLKECSTDYDKYVVIERWAHGK